MVSLIHNIAFDAADPYQLAQFWSQVTGRPVHEDDQPGAPEAAIDLGNGSNLFFQQVPEPKTGKNRVHLCLWPDSTREQEFDRLLELGAELAEDFRQPDGTGWVVLTDPEGNEFCVLRGASERKATSG
ncbi:MAG: VOC family protein [Kibdelosporangium sp.]